MLKPRKRTNIVLHGIRRSPAAAGAAALLALPVAALAQVPPPFIDTSALTAGGYERGSSFGDLVSHYTVLGKPDRLEYASSSLKNIGVPLAVSDAEASGEFSSARSDTTLEYFLQVTGPANVKVPIVAHVGSEATSAMLSGGGVGSVASAESRMWLTNYDAGQFRDDFSVAYRDHVAYQFGMPADVGNNFVADTAFSTRANVDLVTVTLDAYAVVSSSSDFSGKANAILDPYFSIEPSFADAALYKLVVSTGVANTPVPEAATAAMLLGGIVGLVLYRRRRG